MYKTLHTNKFTNKQLYETQHNFLFTTIFKSFNILQRLYTSLQHITKLFCFKFPVTLHNCTELYRTGQNRTHVHNFITKLLQSSTKLYETLHNSSHLYHTLHIFTTLGNTFSKCCTTLQNLSKLNNTLQTKLYIIGQNCTELCRTFFTHFHNTLHTLQRYSVAHNFFKWLHN